MSHLYWRYASRCLLGPAIILAAFFGYLAGIEPSGEVMGRAKVFVRSGLRLALALAVLAGVTMPLLRNADAANLVIDAESGIVISSDAPNHLWYPASLTKMMTVYVALSEIDAGRLSFDDKIKVSAAA